MKIIIEATDKEIADLVLQLQNQRSSKQVQKEREPFTKKSCQTIRLPYSSKVYEVDDTVENQERSLWRRFDVITDNDKQLQAAEKLIADLKLNAYEIALIMSSLRIRPEFDLEYFAQHYPSNRVNL